MYLSVTDLSTREETEREDKLRREGEEGRKRKRKKNMIKSKQLSSWA